jgi:hypothetical protein
MHAGPRPIYHRDIRWANIIKCADDPTKWILIDWDEAAEPPTLAAKNLDKRSHSPAIFKDNHGPEVDIWTVGQLIIDMSNALTRFPRNLLNVGRAMQAGTLNVPQSLQKIVALKLAVLVD